MLNKLKRYLLRINKAAGIELVQLDESKFEMHIVVASVEKKKISQEALPVITHFSNLAATLDIRVPVFITINGKGVLTKTIGKTNSDAISIDNILPNSNLNDYYYEIVQGGNEYYVSLARKVHIDSILTQLSASGYNILGFSLGIGTLEKIVSFAQFDGKKILHTASHVINFDAENAVESIEINRQQEFDQPEYLIGDQYVKSNNLIALGGAVTLISEDLTDNLNTKISSQNNRISDMRHKYKNSKLFQASMYSSLSLVLLLLLINFFIYNNYFNKNQQLEASTAFIRSESIKTDSIMASAKHVQNFIYSSGWNKQSIYSLLSDRIAGMVPESIQLEVMNIYPANSENSDFKHDTILVGGSADDAMEVNKFMNNIKSIKQVKEATVKNYQYKREKEIGNFVMEIIIR